MIGIFLERIFADYLKFAHHRPVRPLQRSKVSCPGFNPIHIQRKREGATFAPDVVMDPWCTFEFVPLGRDEVKCTPRLSFTHTTPHQPHQPQYPQESAVEGTDPHIVPRVPQDM
eukprot:gene20787-biopygen1728